MAYGASDQFLFFLGKHLLRHSQPILYDLVPLSSASVHDAGSQVGSSRGTKIEGIPFLGLTGYIDRSFHRPNIHTRSFRHPKEQLY